MTRKIFHYKGKALNFLFVYGGLVKQQLFELQLVELQLVELQLVELQLIATRKTYP